MSSTGRTDSEGPGTVESAESSTFHDRRHRRIDFHRYGAGPVDDEYEALVELYGTFDPRFRVEGLPPATAPFVRRWLDRILDGHCVVAWHGTRAIGQVVLVPDSRGAHELAIFVHQDYHGEGVGSRLVGAILAVAARAGATRLWLLTTGDNRAMLALALRSGFVVTENASGQVELAMDLTPAEGT